ncbi:MAG: AraC family transcriptional regulator [Bacteroidetes bacterium]|nr:MAG: AraC family transcriptional regulator [Bacteroidota bacterium]
MSKKQENSVRKTANYSVSDLTPRELLEAILNNYKSAGFSVKQFCIDKNTNSSTITTQFSKRYGFCPSTILENLRLEDYLFMLWRPGIKIEEVGAQSGFGSSRRTRAVLNKHLNKSPNSCHKALLEDKGNTKVMELYVRLIWNGHRPDDLLGDVWEHFDRDIKDLLSMFSPNILLKKQPK